MKWSSINHTRIPLLGRIYGLLMRCHRKRRLAVTRHTVRCPLHDCNATVTARTRLRTKRRPRHADIQACSLLPMEPVVPPSRMVWVPDLPYYDIHLQPTRQPPSYPLKVPCRKPCLYILNGAVETGRVRQGRCISGTMDCLELEREATRNTVAETATTQAPWSYSA